MSLKSKLGVALAAAAISSTPACNDEHPVLCSTLAVDEDGKRLPVLRDNDGNIVAVPCQCEQEDKPEKATYHSVDDPKMPAECAAAVNAMIDREMSGTGASGTGGSAGAPSSNPGVSGSGGTAGNPNTCTPTTEVCDGVDNDCDNQTDEGGVCDTPTQGEGFKIYWIPERPYDATDSAAYVPFADQQIEKALRGESYSENIKFLNDSPYAEGNVSKGWATLCLDDYCQGQVTVDPKGLRVGAAIEPNSAVQIPLGYGEFTAQFGNAGPAGLVFVADEGVVINIAGDGSQSTYSYQTPENNAPGSYSNALSAKVSPTVLDDMKLAQEPLFIDMTNKE